MLLLILLAGCLASCAAQTAAVASTMTPAPFTQSVQPTAVLPAHQSGNDVVAILETAVKSSRELNESTVDPVLNHLYDIIQRIHPDLHFSLTVKNVTRV